MNTQTDSILENMPKALRKIFMAYLQERPQAFRGNKTVIMVGSMGFKQKVVKILLSLVLVE